MNRILIVEDDKDVSELLKLYLENSNFQVTMASNGFEALKILKEEEVDLAIIDIMMPVMGGHELIKNIRGFSNMPIIVLSAQSATGEKILGLNMGADDYMTKPFDPLEVVARVNTNLRRCYKMTDTGDTQKKIQEGDLCLDTEKMELVVEGKKVELTSMEYKIILKLMSQPGRVFTKAQIYESVRGEYFESDDSTMMVHISKLREKMGNPRYIKTIRGLGYKLDPQKGEK